MKKRFFGFIRDALDLSYPLKPFDYFAIISVITAVAIIFWGVWSMTDPDTMSGIMNTANPPTK